MITALGKLVHYTTADGGVIPAWICCVDNYPIVNLMAVGRYGQREGLIAVHKAPLLAIAGTRSAASCWQWPQEDA